MKRFQTDKPPVFEIAAIAGIVLGAWLFAAHAWGII